MNKFFFPIFSFLFLLTDLQSQEAMEVIRCTAPELQYPIQNIFVDRDNKKWVGNDKGLFQVHAIDYATEEVLENNEHALLRLRDGNSDIRWSASEMSSILGGEAITAGYYDTKSRELWIGTAESGVIRMKTNPQLSKVGAVNTGNSKLKSNYINSINKDRDGRFWIGTESGVLIGNLNKWKLVEKLFDIQKIAINRNHIWVMGDDIVFKVEEGDELFPIDVTERMVDGEIRDIAVDTKGRLWIASEIVIRYDYETEAFQLFGPAQYFTSQDVNYISVDKDDALWVGTNDKGLYLIEKASAITVTAIVDKPLDCNSTKGTASLKVKVTGGQPPFDYRWEGGLQGDNPQNLSAGVYALTVTDDNGKTKSAKVEVPDPRFSVQVIQEQSESGAGAADAVATVSIEKGGTSPFKYQWDNGETTATAKKLGEGEHSVTVSDKNGCTEIGTVMISQIIAPLSVNIEQKATNNCADDVKAILNATTTGGKIPHQYQWSNGFSGQQPNGLGAGDYSLTVTDATGKTTSAQFNVKAPQKLTAQISVKKSATTNNADGQAIAKASGGTGDYTYQWDTQEKTATASQLNAGNHTVTITDENGCQTTATIEITENILPLAANIEQTAAINCHGESTAALKVEINGGKAPFTYTWSSAELKGAAVQNLGAGTYQVMVKDASAKETKASVDIEQPNLLSGNITVNAAASTGNADGKATVKVSGGTGNYTYQWDNGESNKKAEQLKPGSNTVTITDESGCKTTATVDITENILPLAASIEQSESIKCHGESTAALTVAVNGGKAPFTYVWSQEGLSGEKVQGLGAGTYEVTIKDASGKETKANLNIEQPNPLSANITVNAAASTGNIDGKATVKASGGIGNYTYRWDNGETDKKAEKLKPGSNTVTITDGNGCQTTASVEITENILPLAASIEQTAQIKCHGESTGALAVAVNGGKGPFTYIWNQEGLSGEKVQDLAAGTYEVTVKDVSGKETTANITLAAPVALSASVTIDKPASTDNSDGQATVNAKGGTGNYTYQWDNGENLKTAQKLAPGSHTVTIQDANQCQITAETEISENVLALAVNIEQVSAIKCFDSKEGALSVVISGGKGPFTYEWDNPAAKGEKPTQLRAGTYLLTVTDAKGQTKTAKSEITQPDALSASITAIEPASDVGINDGGAKLVGRGGAGNYTYQWASGETKSFSQKLAIGAQKATVTDGNGCTETVDFEVKKRIIPELQIGRLAVGQVIRLSELNFDADSTVLREDSKPILDEINYFLEQNPTVSIEIAGHTNGVPPHEYCDRLSSERATSIATYLYQKGVANQRVVPKGYGKRKPIASNQTAAGRRRNQRVELKVLAL